MNSPKSSHAALRSRAQQGAHNPAPGIAAQNPIRKKDRRSAQALGAAALSACLVGTFSLPAHAVSSEVTDITIEDFSAPNQSLQTGDADVEAPPIEAPQVELSEEFLEQERQAQEAEEQEAANASDDDHIAPLGKDIPAGEGAQGIVDAAKAQLGVSQDCTDLVQNSLAAIGIIDRRDMGGYDLGPSSGEHVGLGGTIVTGGEYAPGDILFWEGRHNAIYIGNGQAVHGGYSGNQTVIATAYLDGPPDTVVRFG